MLSPVPQSIWGQIEPPSCSEKPFPTYKCRYVGSVVSLEVATMFAILLPPPLFMHIETMFEKNFVGLLWENPSVKFQVL